jgi:hypothetical protein
MKPYGRRTLAKTKIVLNYRMSHAQCVVECAFEIWASKWRILVKAIETKLDTSVETVKCIALLHTIITDAEGLHESLTLNECDSLDANPSTQFKKSRINNCYHFCQTNSRLIL